MHPMRRSDRQVTDLTEIVKILDQCDVCRLGFIDTEVGMPYVVPLNFGYARESDHITLYFHSAREGRKVGLVRRGGTVAFEMDCGHRLVPNDTAACHFTMMFESVMGLGSLREVPEGERGAAFRTFMTHYTDQNLPFDDAMLARTWMFAVEVREMSGKSHL